MLTLNDRSIVLCVLVSAFATEARGQILAAEVDFVVGRVISPANIRSGDSVAIGSQIQTGPDGMIMLRQSWAAPGGMCVSGTVIGYNQSYSVQSRQTPNLCIPESAAIPVNGRPGVTHSRVLDPKTDKPGSDFEKWAMETARRSPRASGVAGMERIVYGMAFVGGDYRSAPTANAADCSAICGREQLCVAATFIESQKLCWLKNSVPPTAINSDMASVLKRK
jgi:hypothetical protein